MARRKIVAGNWKMNKTPTEAKALVEMLAPLVKSDDVDVVYCVPAIDIVPVVEAVKGTNVAVGAENGLKVGAPYVEGATVSAKVLKNGKAKKITVFTYKPKKGKQRKIGHRQPYTQVQIEAING